jgi:RhtB (resistance to homoserine/threonine) family protein
MFGITNFGTFVIAGILLNITPGSDTIYILSRSISQGKRAGLFSALGISAGCLIHTLLAAFGLSVILAQSAAAFNTVKYLGAFYLVYLGVKTLFAQKKNGFDLSAEAAPVSDGRIFISGVLTNVLNPKVALFFLAFLPQFIDPAFAESAIPFLILGLTFVFNGAIWCCILALGASGLARTIKQNYSVRTWLDRVTGLVFVALGLKLAFLRK